MLRKVQLFLDSYISSGVAPPPPSGTLSDAHCHLSALSQWVVRHGCVQRSNTAGRGDSPLPHCEFAVKNKLDHLQSPVVALAALGHELVHHGDWQPSKWNTDISPSRIWDGFWATAGQKVQHLIGIKCREMQFRNSSSVLPTPQSFSSKA